MVPSMAEFNMSIGLLDTRFLSDSCQQIFWLVQSAGHHPNYSEQQPRFGGHLQTSRSIAGPPSHH